MMRRTSLVLCAALTAAACGGNTGDDTNTDSGTDASTAHDSGGACNTLANIAQTITIQQVPSAPPEAQGGTFVDGTYAMTDYTIYTGSGGATGPAGTTQTTLQIDGGTFQVVTDATPATRTVRVVVSGSSVAATDTCPDSTAFQETFTATAAAFIVYIAQASASGSTVAETFTKQ